MTNPRTPNYVDAHIGNQLRIRRKELRMSQERLGELLGVTFQQVQKYEKGMNGMRGSKLYSAAVALTVTVSYFYEGLPDTVTSSGQATAAQTGTALHGFIQSVDGVEFAIALQEIEHRAVRRSLLEHMRTLGRSRSKPRTEPNG